MYVLVSYVYTMYIKDNVLGLVMIDISIQFCNEIDWCMLLFVHRCV